MQFGPLSLKRCRYGWMLYSGPLIGKCFDLYGEYSESEIAMMRGFLSDGSTVVDVGANIGDLTVPLAGIVGASGRVYAFESHPENFNVLCGNLALNNLNKAVKSESGASMELGNIIKVYGMNLRELILPQGRILLRTHPLFNRHATFSASMLCLSFSEIKRRYIQETDFQDNIQTKGEDVIKGQWLTEDGLQVTKGGLTQAYLGNINFTTE